MKLTLFIAAALCLTGATAQTQQIDRSETGNGREVTGGTLPGQRDNDSGGEGTEIAWSLAAGYGMHRIRQHDASEDNSIAVMFGAEIQFMDVAESATIAFRPALLYAKEAMLVDVGVSFRYGNLPAIFAGIGVDVLGESSIDYRWDEDFWSFVLERDEFAKRLFAQIGLRYTYSQVFIELQHRTELKKGVHAYWNPAQGGNGREHPAGYRRQFVSVLMLGVTL